MKVGGKWGRPINPGKAINTEFLEGCPNPSLDMTTLYFSSGRKGSIGQQDIYVANGWITGKKPDDL